MSENKNTPAVVALAKELCELGLAVAYPDGKWTYEPLGSVQQEGWCTVARRVLLERPLDRLTLAALLARQVSADFTIEGIHAVLDTAGIVTRTNAYKRGYRDAVAAFTGEIAALATASPDAAPAPKQRRAS